jgi:hypothetical protein
MISGVGLQGWSEKNVCTCAKPRVHIKPMCVGVIMLAGLPIWLSQLANQEIACVLGTTGVIVLSAQLGSHECASQTAYLEPSSGWP